MNQRLQAAIPYAAAPRSITPLKPTTMAAMIARRGARTEQAPLMAQAQGMSPGARSPRSLSPVGKGIPMRRPGSATARQRSAAFRGRGQEETAALGLLVAAAGFLLPLVSTAVSPWPLPLKAALLCLAVALPGLLMGIPFPAGLRLLGERAPDLIPWAWAINGACSVLAPLLAIMAAMVVGFQGVILLGSAAYGMAACNLWFMERTRGG